MAESSPEVIVHSPDDGRTYGGPGTVVLDATGIDTEDGVLADDIAAHSLAVAAPAAVGTAASSQAAVSYTAASASGYDAISYEVCDVSGQCSTAEVTMIVISDA